LLIIGASLGYEKEKERKKSFFFSIVCLGILVAIIITNVLLVHNLDTAADPEGDPDDLRPFWKVVIPILVTSILLIPVAIFDKWMRDIDYEDETF